MRDCLAPLSCLGYRAACGAGRARSYVGLPSRYQLPLEQLSCLPSYQCSGIKGRAAAAKADSPADCTALQALGLQR